MNDHGENLFKALADRQRRKILEMLRRGELPAGDIALALDLAPATVSHHLAKLKAANLVRTRRAGQQRIYALNVSVIEEALLLVAGLLTSGKELNQ